MSIKMNVYTIHNKIIVIRAGIVYTTLQNKMH